MARSKKKSSARATSEAKAPAVAPETDDLDALSPDDAEGTRADTADATSSTSAKDPVKRSRAATAKDPVAKKGPAAGKGAGKGAGKPSDKATASGSEVTEKAKDATRSPAAKKAAAVETARTNRRRVAVDAPNPPWLAPTAVVLLILGLLYLVTYYLSAGQLPLPIGDWNLAAGFGVMLVGGGMLMFWK